MFAIYSTQSTKMVTLGDIGLFIPIEYNGLKEVPLLFDSLTQSHEVVKSAIDNEINWATFWEVIPIAEDVEIEDKSVDKEVSAAEIAFADFLLDLNCHQPPEANPADRRTWIRNNQDIINLFPLDLNLNKLRQESESPREILISECGKWAFLPNDEAG